MLKIINILKEKIFFGGFVLESSLMIIRMLFLLIAYMLEAGYGYSVKENDNVNVGVAKYYINDKNENSFRYVCTPAKPYDETLDDNNRTK